MGSSGLIHEKYALDRRAKRGGVMKSHEPRCRARSRFCDRCERSPVSVSYEEPAPKQSIRVDRPHLRALLGATGIWSYRAAQSLCGACDSSGRRRVGVLRRVALRGQRARRVRRVRAPIGRDAWKVMPVGSKRCRRGAACSAGWRSDQQGVKFFYSLDRCAFRPAVRALAT